MSLLKEFINMINKIKEFDNLSDNTVFNFNRIFNTVLPFNVDFEVEILEPITTDGRKLLINNKIEYNFIDYTYPALYADKPFKACYMFGKFLGIFKTPQELSQMINFKIRHVTEELEGEIKGLFVLDILN